MKKILLGLCALCALALGSCSNDDVKINESAVSDGQPRYVTVNLVNTDGATTRGQQYSENPNNALYEDGEAAENQVNNVVFFFFDDEGNAKIVTGNKASGHMTGKNYLNITNFSDLGNDHTLTVEKILSTTLVIQVEKGTQLPTQMAAVVNVPWDRFTSATYSVDELNSIVADFKTNHASAGAFIMASSVWSEGDNNIAEINTAEVSPYPSKEQAMLNPTKIYVERNLAKVRVKLAPGISSGATGAGETITKDDVKYVSTSQKIKLDPNNNATEVEIYAKFDNWYVTSESNESFLIKSLARLSNATNLWANWTMPSLHRCYWAYTPTDVKTTTTGYKYIEKNFEYLYNKWNPDIAKGYAEGSNEYYTQENTFKSYVSNTAQNSTLNKDAKVVISAELGYFTADNTWNALTVGMFGHELYPMTSSNDYLLEAALQYLQDQGQLDYWYYEDNEWKQIDKTFFAYQGISKYTNDNYNKTDVNTLLPIARYESRIILNETVATTKGQWYKDLADDPNVAGAKLAPASQPPTSKIELSGIISDLGENLPNVKVWTEGKAYYYFPIRHLGNGTATAPLRGYYGVVRNHIYDCTISTLVGLGTPVFDPEEFIVPEPVEEDKDTYVAAQINILSWRVVSQKINLK